MWEIDSIRLVRLSKLLTDPACFALSSHQTRSSLDSGIKYVKYSKWYVKNKYSSHSRTWQVMLNQAQLVWKTWLLCSQNMICPKKNGGINLAHALRKSCHRSTNINKYKANKINIKKRQQTEWKLKIKSKLDHPSCFHPRCEPYWYNFLSRKVWPPW